MSVTVTYSPDKSAAKISTGRGYPFVVSAALIEHLGSAEAALDLIRAFDQNRYLPRRGSESRPLTVLDLHYAGLNARIGRRHYVYRTFTGSHVRQATGYDSVWGYGCPSDDGSRFLIYERDADGSRFVRFSVPLR